MEPDRQFLDGVARFIHRRLPTTVPTTLSLSQLGLSNGCERFIKRLHPELPPLNEEDIDAWQTIGDVVSSCARYRLEVVIFDHHLGLLVTADGAHRTTVTLPPFLPFSTLQAEPFDGPGLAIDLATVNPDGRGVLCRPIPVEVAAAWQTSHDVSSSAWSYRAWERT